MMVPFEKTWVQISFFQNNFPGETRAVKWGRHSSRDNGQGGDGEHGGGRGGEKGPAQHDGPQ